MIVQADATRLPFEDESFDLVIGSPPYVDCRTYLEDGVDLGIARDAVAWVEWMVRVTAEALRVSRGLVIWVCAGKTEERSYQPACEGLTWEWFKRGGALVNGYRQHFGPFLQSDGTGRYQRGEAYRAFLPGDQLRPVIWHRVGIAGSGGDQWFRADTEYCLAFKRPGPLPYANNTANGHRPLWAPGGAMSHRLTDGTRRNEWGGGAKSGGNRRKNGDKQLPGRPSHTLRKAGGDPAGPGLAFGTEPDDLVEVQADEREPIGNKTSRRRRGSDKRESTVYVPPALANPGNLIHTKTGGNNMGSKLAHKNEAPYPEAVPAWFIASHTPPKGKVFDPFGGSGTTIAAARKLDRQGWGCDLRRSQVELMRARRDNTTPGLPFDDCEDEE